MCNNKGWNIVYGDIITIEPHFCRTYGDCGSVDNTLEQAVSSVVAIYQEEFDYLQSNSTDPDIYDTERLMTIVSEMVKWKNCTHPDYLFFKQLC